MKIRAALIFVPVILASAAVTRVTLIDEIVRIPSGDWRYVHVALKQRPAFISAYFEGERGGPPIRLALVPRENPDHLPRDLAQGALAVTAPAVSGRLRYRIPVRGIYAILIDNRNGAHPANIHLRVFLDFGERLAPGITRLSPWRRFTVIAISFAVFFAVVVYSARRLLRSMRL